MPSRGFQWNLQKVDCPFGGHQPERVHAEALHHAVTARDAAVRHDPHEHMSGFRHQRYKVPKCIVSSRRLRNGVVRFGLGGMDQVGKFERILDEEDRDVVAHQVPVALIGVELDGEAAHVARRVGRAALARHRRETHEHGRALALLREQRGAGEFAERLVGLEVAMRAPNRVRARCAPGCARDRNALFSREE